MKKNIQPTSDKNTSAMSADEFLRHFGWCPNDWGSSEPYTMNVLEGCSLDGCFDDALTLAKALQRDITFTFNTVHCLVHHTDTIERKIDFIADFNRRLPSCWAGKPNAAKPNEEIEV